MRTPVGPRGSVSTGYQRPEGPTGAGYSQANFWDATLLLPRRRAHGLFRAAPPRVAIPGQASRDGLRERRGRVGAPAPHVGRRLRRLAPDDVLHLTAREGRLSRQHLVAHHAQAVDVGPAINIPRPAGLLGTPVLGRADDDAADGEAGAVRP